MKEYIGTIDIHRGIVMYLSGEIISIYRGNQTHSLTIRDAVKLAVQTTTLKQSEGLRLNGIPVSYDRMKALRNLILRGLDMMGCDTSDLRMKFSDQEEQRSERREGINRDDCDEVSSNEL